MLSPLLHTHPITATIYPLNAHQTASKRRLLYSVKLLTIYTTEKDWYQNTCDLCQLSYENTFW